MPAKNEVINHGIRMNEMINGIRRFNEQDTEVKKQFYSSNFAQKSGVANWKDTFGCNVAPDSTKPEELPDVCSFNTYFTFIHR
uniref:Uncharacterized protein n=1 Tax=Salix viminalis TaxID=40686 RepID=A0A6N2LXA0_SALVM